MKLGIIGAGKIVHDFLTVANSISDVQLVAISAPPQNLPELKNSKLNMDLRKYIQTIKNCFLIAT